MSNSGAFNNGPRALNKILLFLMSYYSYRRSKYGRRRRYYRHYRKGSSRFTRKLRRSLNQKDTCRLILTSKPETVTLQYNNLEDQTSGTVGYYTKVMTFNPMYKLMGAVTNTNPPVTLIEPMQGFIKFQELFDQFKVNAIRIRIQVVAQPAPQTYCAGLLRTAIDRNGISPQFNTAIESQVNAPTEGYKDTIIAANKIFESYSSFQQKIMNSTDMYAIYRTFYPIGKEKGTWFGASHTYVENDNEHFNISNHEYPFKPILFLQFFISSLQANGGSNVMYNIQFEYDITFKGQRNISE